MSLARVMVAMPALLVLMYVAQLIGAWAAPEPGLRDAYASTGLLTLVALLMIELPRLFEFVAAAPDGGHAEQRARSSLEKLIATGALEFRPRLHVLQSTSKSAISFGVPRNGVIFITSGLADSLDDDALEVTLAHEAQHVAHRHALFHYAFVLLVIATKMILGVSVWFAPLYLMAYLAVLREFEYAADRGAAAMLGRDRVALALRKVQRAISEKEFGPLAEILGTHPPFGKRIARVLNDSAARAAAA